MDENQKYLFADVETNEPKGTAALHLNGLKTPRKTHKNMAGTVLLKFKLFLLNLDVPHNTLQ